MPFVFLGDGRETQQPPASLLHNVPDQVVLMQPLHDDDDAARILIIEPAVQGVVVPGIRSVALRFRQRFIRLQWIVDDDEIRTAPGQNAADRGGEPGTFPRGPEFLHGLAG